MPAVSFYLPEGTLRELRNAARARETSVSRLIRTAVESHLDAEAKKRAKGELMRLLAATDLGVGKRPTPSAQGIPMIGADTGFFFALREGDPVALGIFENEDIAVSVLTRFELKRLAHRRGIPWPDLGALFTRSLTELELTEEAADEAAGAVARDGPAGRRRPHPGESHRRRLPDGLHARRALPPVLAPGDLDHPVIDRPRRSRIFSIFFSMRP